MKACIAVVALVVLLGVVSFVDQVSANDYHIPNCQAYCVGKRCQGHNREPNFDCVCTACEDDAKVYPGDWDIPNCQYHCKSNGCSYHNRDRDFACHCANCN